MTLVAFCPTLDSVSPLIATVQLNSNPIVIAPPDDVAKWVSHVAATLAKTAEPLILVFYGEAAVHAPAIGFSRRSLRRPAISYVLVDPQMPKVGGEYGDWPDAPVTVLISENPPEFAREAAMQSRLRGWNISSHTLQEVLTQ